VTIGGAGRAQLGNFDKSKVAALILPPRKHLSSQSSLLTGGNKSLARSPKYVLKRPLIFGLADVSSV
jgi:hypothetical protein